MSVRTRVRAPPVPFGEGRAVKTRCRAGAPRESNLRQAARRDENTEIGDDADYREAGPLSLTRMAGRRDPAANSGAPGLIHNSGPSRREPAPAQNPKAHDQRSAAVVRLIMIGVLLAAFGWGTGSLRSSHRRERSRVRDEPPRWHPVCRPEQRVDKRNRTVRLPYAVPGFDLRVG